VFALLAPPEGAEADGLRRETRRELPAKRDWERPGSGGRDVVVWHTAVEACRTGTGPFVLVSNDASAFGPGGVLHPALSEELRMRLGDDAERFTYRPTLASALDTLVESHPEHRLTNETVAHSPTVLDALERDMASGETFFELLTGAGLVGKGTFTSRAAVLDPALSSLGKVVAYRVGETALVCSNPRWTAHRLLTGDYALPGGQARNVTVRVEYAFTTALNMTLSDEGGIVAADATRIGRCREIVGRLLD
jgi:hypothetical protein